MRSTSRRRPSPTNRLPSVRRPRGYSILEVLVSLVILFGGIVSILTVFPNVLKTNDRSIAVAEAALLAQQKVEEIRRDTDGGRRLISSIRQLQSPTPPVAFPGNSNLVYRFSGVSLIDPVDDPGDPRDDHGVARVIVQYAEEYRSGGKVLFELRFDE